MHRSRKDIYFRPFLPTLLVFAALMVLIILSWRTAVQDVTAQRSRSVADKASFVQGALQQRLSIYENTLRSSAALFGASENVTRNEWKDFVDSLNLHERYPGILAVNYVKIVTDAERPVLVQAVRDEGFTNFNIYPASGRGTYAPLLYVALTGGQEETNQVASVLGYDMYSDPTRKAAMESAMLSGEPVLSNALNLLQSPNQSLNGFLLYMPLYKKNMPQATVEERRASIDGFFYAAFLAKSIFSSLFVMNEPAFGFSIYDGPTDASANLYESSPNLSSPDFEIAEQDLVSLYSQRWSIIYKTTEEIVPVSIRRRPYGVAVGGVIFSATLASTLYLLIQRRTRSLTYNEQKKLDEAKDELLSLASHQLRTPATAVKQYVSMVKNGFAGKVTAEQRKLLQMAYESNERQLTTVDDLLYVARVDSGQASLKIEKVNLSELLRSVVHDQGDILKARSQKLQLKGASKNVFTEGDPHYLRMIFENLLSNASKYSRERKKIAITLRQMPDKIMVTFIDQGVGIEPEDNEDVFQKFSRIPNELTRQTAGSGIGLYLAKQLALLHNGDITFSSVPKVGSSFIVTLPKKQPPESV